MEALGSLLRDIDELSDVVADVEPGGAGLPVLMRQYANLGGVFIEFNVDPQFSNVLDGLVLVDLRTTEQRLLERYLGKTGAEQYMASQNG
jgi:hypothetical protein